MLFKSDQPNDLLNQRIAEHFAESINTQQQTLLELQSAILSAARQMAHCLSQHGKILACGNGGSATDAQHFSGEMLGRLEQERPGLAACALTADTATLTAVANDYGYSQVFARQIEAMGQSNDILLAITTSGQSDNILQAVLTAQSMNMNVIALSGRDGGQLARVLRSEDIELRVPASRTMRIQEAHIIIIHSLCDLVDQLLFSGDY